jgi:hypothetical protein
MDKMNLKVVPLEDGEERVWQIFLAGVLCWFSTPTVSFSQPGVERGFASDTPGRPVKKAFDTNGVVQGVPRSERHRWCRKLFCLTSQGVGRSALNPGL